MIRLKVEKDGRGNLCLERSLEWQLGEGKLAHGLTSWLPIVICWKRITVSGFVV